MLRSLPGESFFPSLFLTNTVQSFVSGLFYHGEQVSFSRPI